MRYPSGKKFVKYIFDGHREDGCGLTDVLAQDVRDSISNEYDSIITVVGNVGVGKSNCGVDVAVSCDPTFTLEDRYVYDLLPFLKKLQARWNDLKPGMCFLMDEATNLANNRNWNDSVNKYFTQFLEMFRSLGLILILIIPTKERLDIYLREGNRTRYFITVLDLANGGKYEGRGFYELEILDNGQRIYVGIGTFPKMDISYLENYAELKKQSQKAKLDEMIASLEPKDKKENDKGRDKEMALWFMLHEGWETKEVARQFNIPEGTLRRWRSEFKRDAEGY